MDQAVFISLAYLFNTLVARINSISVPSLVIALAAFSCAGAANAAKNESSAYDFGGAASQYESKAESKGLALWVGKAKKMALYAFTQKEAGQFARVGVIKTNNYSDSFKNAFEESESRVFGIKLNYKF